MPTTLETYCFTTTVQVPCLLPVDPAALPLRRAAVGGDVNGGALILSIEPHEKETRLAVEWSISLPFDPVFQWRDSDGTMRLPPEKPGGFAWPYPAEVEILKALDPFLVRLCHSAQNPAFLFALEQTEVAQLISGIHVEVSGQSVDLAPRAFRLRYPPHVGLPLDASKLASVLQQRSCGHHYFGSLADRMFYGFETFGIIAALTSELEVASYEHLGTRVTDSNGNAQAFNPSRYFGSTNAAIAAGVPLKTSDNWTYTRCHELWGTRHEVLHNGQGRIRIYDPAQDRVDRSNTRQIKDSDLIEFRIAVGRAVEWLESA